MVAVELPPDITASFVAEARSYLPQIVQSLANPADGEALSEAYRFAHTIKSSAAMMGHVGLSQVAELMEGDLECMLLGEETTPPQLAQLTRSVSRIARLLDSVSGEAEVDVDAVIAEEVDDRLALQAGNEPALLIDETILDAPAESPLAAQPTEAPDQRIEVIHSLEAVESVEAVEAADTEEVVEASVIEPAIECALLEESLLEAAADLFATLPSAELEEAPSPFDLFETAPPSLDPIEPEPSKELAQAVPAGTPDAPAAEPEEPTADDGTGSAGVSPASDEGRAGTPALPGGTQQHLPGRAQPFLVAPLPARESTPLAHALLPGTAGVSPALTPLLDTLAETVLAFEREAASGVVDLASQRDAVAGWLAEFEAAAGLAPPTLAAAAAPQAPVMEASAPAAPQPVELDPATDREAALRRAIEAEIRFQVEEEVRRELAGKRQEQDAPRPLLSFSPRLRQGTPAGTAAKPAPLPQPQPEADGLFADPEMREIFALEANEHLKRIDADVAALDAAPNDMERLRSLRRSVHTLKGAAAMMGFGAVAELAHSLEDRLDEATSSEAGFDNAAFAVLLSDLDRLEALISGSPLPATGAAMSPLPLGEAGEGARAGGGEGRRGPAPGRSAGEGSAATDTDSRPHPSPLPEGEGVPAAITAVPVRLDYLDELLTMAGETSVSMSRWPELLSAANGALTEMRRTAARVNTLLTALQSERHRRLEEAGISTLMAGTGRPALVGGTLGGLQGIVRGPTQTDFDALELDRYTPTDYVAHELAQIAAEAAAAERELASSLEGAADLSSAQRRQATEMQERLLTARLVPLDELSGRLQRAARGVALKREKEIDFVFEGADVAVDRAVLDAISDALQHLVRNAVDHGIEPVDVRAARGKAAAGTVCVSARQAQGEVVIEVTDDGAGIDLRRVAAAAREAGLDTAGDDRTALELIFRPGLSTKDEVDEVSGRGVGLDAVAEAMARVHGTVEVASEPGAGTVFSLRFPVTLAQARVVMAETAGNPVAILAASVKHVGRLGDLSLEQTGEGTIARLAGQPFPVGSLAEALGMADEALPADPPVLLVEAGGRRAAWIASVVGSQEDVVVKSLGGHLKAPRGVAGATLLQDGRVALLLHAADVLGQSGVSAATWQRPENGATGRNRSGRRGSGDLRVLVVDDSPTIRKLLVRMLRDLGWQPVEAKDGAEALESIRLSRPDVVLADIEMPRLDGYGLLAALRSQAATADLPVLMLTSRTADRHRQRAMDLGASGYLTKPYRPEDVAAALRQLGTPTAVA